MTERILFVDDEINVLEGIRRTLRTGYHLLFATSAARGLELAERHEDLAVVVSDLRMPVMDGVSFLAGIRQVRPHAVRMVLSGQADLDTALAAVNDGQLFRFLTKPVSREQLVEGLEAALTAFRDRRAEQELLEGTVAAAVALLAESLSLANPVAFHRTARILTAVEAIADGVKLGMTWEIRVAVLLSQIGCLSIPSTVLRKVAAGEELENRDMLAYDRHPAVAAAMVRRIPRMEGVADLVSRQRRPGPEPLEDPHRELAASVLRAASEYDLLASRGVPVAEIPAMLTGMDLGLPPEVIKATSRVRIHHERTEVRRVAVDALTPDMVIEQDVMSTAGVLLVPKGQRVTDSVASHLVNFAVGTGIVEPLVVRAPVHGARLDAEAVFRTLRQPAATPHKP